MPRGTEPKYRRPAVPVKLTPFVEALTRAREVGRVCGGDCAGEQHMLVSPAKNRYSVPCEFAGATSTVRCDRTRKWSSMLR